MENKFTWAKSITNPKSDDALRAAIAEGEKSNLLFTSLPNVPTQFA